MVMMKNHQKISLINFIHKSKSLKTTKQNKMETKKITIDLSLEKARKWFNSDNKELKDIAIHIP